MGLLVCLLVIAGCTTNTAPPSSGEPEAFRTPAILADGRIAVDVPVDVFLIGLGASVAQDLADALAPVRFAGSLLNATTTAPKNEAEVAWLVSQPDLITTNALVTTAQFRVHTVPDEIAVQVAELAGESVAEDGHITANVLEDRITELLAEVGPGLDTNRTSLVILDIGQRDHTYRYHGTSGWRAPIRTFGERTGLVIWDPYAAPDPWVGEELAHHRPLDGAPIHVLQDWVERATLIRALQMPAYPPPMADCHALTVLFAVRGTTVTPALFAMQTWEEAIDVPRIQDHFTELVSGEEVFVDLVVVHLPQGDPPLEAATREHGSRQAMYEWIDLNYDAYHVPHEGCERYLSLIIYGDLPDQRTVSNGIAWYYSADGHRASFSIVSELMRFQAEVLGYNQHADELSQFDRVGAGANATEWFNWLVAHETGHLFGQPHPNFAAAAEDPASVGGNVAGAAASVSDQAFASTWNVMGYQMRRSTSDFGQVDDTNLARNRAGWALRDAVHGGLQDTPAFDDAMLALGEYRWQDALDTIRAAQTPH